jgi:hypothetical protein
MAVYLFIYLFIYSCLLGVMLCHWVSIFQHFEDVQCSAFFLKGIEGEGTLTD